jgi:hypothetical protein
MPTYAPQPHDANLHAFISVLREQPIRPAKGLSLSSFENHGQLLEVPVKPVDGYPANYCWFNCLEHCLTHDGSVVFGWGIWQRGPSHFVAQHHAVWRPPLGALVDVTTNETSNNVLFIPDNRAPFDFHQLRCPFNFEWKGHGSELWFASDDAKSPTFAIAALQPTSTEAPRIDRIRQLAIKHNRI